MGVQYIYIGAHRFLRLHLVYGKNVYGENVISEQFIPNVLVPYKFEHGLPIIKAAYFNHRVSNQGPREPNPRTVNLKERYQFQCFLRQNTDLGCTQRRNAKTKSSKSIFTSRGKFKKISRIFFFNHWAPRGHNIIVFLARRSFTLCC